MLILDSGAFSAWTKKVEIKIDDYIAFIKSTIDVVDHYVNLDVIPAEFGRKPTEEEVEASAQASWDNMVYMESEGLHPIPVYHMGEGLEWLDKLINHGCDYIGISPANDRTTKQKIEWLDMVFNHICDKDGIPCIKTHGFGVTSLPILYRYPWYSCDSMSWLRHAAYGSILVPKYDHHAKVMRYDLSPHIVAFSDKSSSRKEKGKHFETYGKLTQKFILDYITERGYTAEDLKTDHYKRAEMCAIFFMEVSEYNQVKTFKPSMKRKLIT